MPTPTADEINALPPDLRKYIHDLETECDPAGTIRQNMHLQDLVQQLRAQFKSDRREFKERVYCAALTGLLSAKPTMPSFEAEAQAMSHVHAAPFIKE